MRKVAAKNGLLIVLLFAFLGLVGGRFMETASFETKLSSEESYQDFKENLKDMDERQLYKLVDSLLVAQSKDPILLDLVQKKISGHFDKIESHDDEPYPADRYYHSWCTTKSHPYKDSLSRGDSTLQLDLVDEDWNCGYQAPFEGVLTSGYGWRHGKMHNGVDIDLVTGDTVRSAFRGVVRLAKWQGGYGRVVIVRHHNGLETFYAHLYRFLVKEGDVVDPGTPIGRGGNSGKSRGSHLHLETRFKGKPINPQCFIDFSENKLKSDTLLLKKTKYGYMGYQPGGAYHKVRYGDYLWKIANEYGTTINKICQLNGIPRNHFLVVGEELKVSN